MASRVPMPAPRKVRKLPIAFIVVSSVLGIAFFLFLWNIAVGLQEQNMPRHKAGTYEAK